MARPLAIAGIQMAMGEDRGANLANAIRQIETAARRGATLVVLPELFTGRYFPREPDRPEFLAWAEPVPGPTTRALADAAGRLGVAIVGSVYERAMAGLTYNTAVLLSPDGALAGKSRKAHIPEGPGYAEKFYFAPGDSDYPVFVVPTGSPDGPLTAGLATCWDQWYPEVARILALRGAELIAYPTAIGSEPSEPDLDTQDSWRTVMRGHAVANALFVVAVNRVGTEGEITFYGGSFVADPMGRVVAELGSEPGILETEIDLDAIEETRRLSTFFRDRRPETYGLILGRGGS